MEDFCCDSYCGLYCGACEILHAYTHSLHTGETPKWDDLPEVFRENITQAEIKCYGCKSDTVFVGCSKCEIRACAKKRGVDYCIHCTDFPCTIITTMKERLTKISAFLPHTKSIIANLEIIKEIGSHRWLQKEKEKWTCKKCGAPTTWYQKKCTRCNNEITD